MKTRKYRSNNWNKKVILRAYENFKLYVEINKLQNWTNFKTNISNIKDCTKKVFRAAKAYAVNKQVIATDNLPKTA